MLISKKMNAAINGQVGNEFTPSPQYVAIASHFASLGLTELAPSFSSKLARSASTRCVS